MHARYVSVPVPHVARGIACCVSDEFIHGVHHLLMMMQILLCADSAPLPIVELTHFQAHSVKMKRHFVISGRATDAAVPPWMAEGPVISVHSSGEDVVGEEECPLVEEAAAAHA